MNDPIPPTSAKEAIRRWKRGMDLMNAFVLSETRRATPSERARDLEDLHSIAIGLPADPRREVEVGEVRRRWARLRTARGRS